MRRSIVALVAFVLVLQPFVIMASFTMPIHNNLAEEDSSYVMAQDPGSRLEPGEYTNHVPFEIDGTSDFGVLGFPGSGSVASPYVIEGLNITADVGQVCIRIINTNAYFVIWDCYIDQNSNDIGVMLVNTTHGTIEYTTILSEGPALDFVNANNTVVSHSLAYGNNGFALLITMSEHVTVEWNDLSSTNSFGLYVINGNYFTSTQNEVSTVSGGLAYYIVNSNHSVSTFDTTIHDFYVQSSHFISVSDLTSSGGMIGLFVSSSPNSDFTRCNINQISVFGGYFDSSPDTTITQSSFTDSGDMGVYIVNSNNTVFSNNIIDDTVSFGLYMVACYSSEVSMNTVSNTGFMGMLFAGRDDLTLDTNTVTHTQFYGVYLENVDRPVISNLDVLDTQESSFYVSSSDNGSLTDSSFVESNDHGVEGIIAANWIITDNTFADINDIGLYCIVMDNVDIQRNDFTNIGGEGIRVDVCSDAQVIDNTITKSVSDGLSVSDSPRLVVDSNILTDCYAGFTIDNSINITVEQNTISGTSTYGMNLNNLDSPEIRNNIIQDAYHMGINIDLVWEGVFENNHLTNCGIFFQHGYILLFYNQTMIGNTVNSKPIYYGLSANNLNLNGDNYGQIILANCSFVDISSGEFVRASSAIQLHLSDEIMIDQVVARYNSRAFIISWSDNVTITDCVIEGQFDYNGIYVSDSVRVRIEGCTITRHTGTDRIGIYVYDSDFNEIIDCDLSNNYDGVYVSQSLNSSISDCDILNSEIYALRVGGFSMNYPIIEGNTILNSTYGVYVDDGDDGIIRNNLIMYSSLYGIYLTGSNNNYNVTLNTVENNRDGIFVAQGDWQIITNNTVQWNSRYGIYVTGAGNVQVYYNIIAFSGTDNGYHSLGGTDWDDGIMLGNWWSDYTPPGVYAVDGNTDDNFPMAYAPTEPLVNQPMDIYYAEGSTGNEITWLIADDYLRDWEVTIDGELWASEAWDFVDVTVGIDGLAYGTYTVVMTIWDVDMNSVSDTVIVHVYDGTKPTINDEENRVAFVDGSGQSVEWTAFDLHPSNYRFYIDDEIVSTGTWTSGPVEGSLDGLTLGEHIVLMVVYDLDGNSRGDSLLVRVVDDDTVPTIDSPEDIIYTEGSTGNVIIWTPIDEYPESYRVTYNGSIIRDESWGGSRIVLNVDDLPVGTHTFLVSVIDGSSNSVSDQVMVTVLPVTPVTPPALLDLTVLGIVAAIGGAIVIVFVVLYFLRKREII